MAFDDDHARPPITPNTLDILSFNPFAGHLEQLAFTTSNPESYVSSLGLTNGPSPYRRHAHSHSDLGVRNNGTLHPLRSAGLASDPANAGITRPHLSRIVNVGTLVDTTVSQPKDVDFASFRNKEKDVLVHEVRATVTLLMAIIFALAGGS